MSLQRNIADEMFQYAIKIIRRGLNSSDPKTKKMCEAWFDLKRLLDIANSVVEVDTKMSKEAGKNVESEEV